MNNFSNLRVLLFGVGRMGKVYFQSLKLLGIKNIHVYDRDKDILSEFATTAGGAKEYFSVNIDTLNWDLYDLFIIATTADSRLEIVKSITSKIKNKFILCEKPLAQSLEDSRTIIKLCELSNSRLAVNHQMRFLPQYTLIKQYLDSKDLGDLVSMNVSASNVGLSMNVTHYIEAFNWITENSIDRVAGFLDTEYSMNPRGKQFFDRSGFLVGLNDCDQRFIIDFSGRAGNGIVVVYSFNFGKITINELTGEVLIFGRNPYDLNEPSTRYGLESWHRSLRVEPVELVSSTSRLIEAFLKNESYPSGLNALNSLKTIVAAVESDSKNHRLVDVNNLKFQNIKFPWA